MICNTQVRTHSAGTCPIGFGIVSAPSAFQWVTENTQCHSTTTRMLNARRKSTERSRVSGVAATRSSIVVLMPPRSGRTAPGTIRPTPQIPVGVWRESAPHGRKFTQQLGRKPTARGGNSPNGWLLRREAEGSGGLGEDLEVRGDGRQPRVHRVDREVARAGSRASGRRDRPTCRDPRPSRSRGPPCRSCSDRAPRPQLHRRRPRARRRGALPVALAGTNRRRGGRRGGTRVPDATPNHNGIGCCTGIGAKPAPVTWSKRPSCVTERSVHRRRKSPTCSSSRRPRVEKSSPSASYSTVFHPSPMPRRKRPSVSRSTSAACFATSAVWRCGRMMIPVTSSIGVSAAR